MTAIYKTGTVSVNNGSNIVTGNGTSFIDVANVQEGDLFTLDGQKFYEIYEVDTNTQIKIRNLVTGGAFAETNVTAGNFAIIRNFTSQTSAEIAGKVLAVQQKWMNREEEMTDWFYTANDWATVTSINGDELSVMTPSGINNLLGTAADKDVTTSSTDTAANRVLKVGDAGILTMGSPPSVLPDNTQYPSMFARDGDGAGGYPIFGWAASILNMRFNNTRQSQLGISNGGAANIAFRTMGSDNTWSGPYDLFGEHNSVNPIDYGAAVKNKTLAAATNLDNLIDNGKYTGFGLGSASASTGDNPFSGNGAFAIDVSSETFGTDNYTLQTATWYANNLGIITKQRVKTLNSGSWTPWYTQYNSSNTNFNVFSSAFADDHLAFGYATSTTAMRLYFPLSSMVAPSSITVTGTFKVTTAMLTGTGNDNITSLALHGNSSAKIGAVNITGLTGLTAGNPYLLRPNSSDASITFNF